MDGNESDGVDVGASSSLTMYGPEIWNNGSRRTVYGIRSIIV